jgi:hypothetical protein
MSTVTARSILDRAWIVVQDTAGSSGVRWPEAEMLSWVNDAQREIVLLHPQASVSTSSPVVPTGTRQSLAGLSLSSGIRVIDVIRNMSNAGVPGRAIRLITREVLDAQRPSWHSETGSEIIHWMYDPRDTKSFYVYPALSSAAISAAAKIELIYSSSPAVLDDVTDTIAVDDVYANAILNYVLFRAYSKDAEYAQNVALSQAYYQLFMGALTAKTQIDVASQPSAQAGTYNPAVK